MEDYNITKKKQNIEGTEQILVPSLEKLECEKRNGLVCTTANQTIADLLEQNGDEQIITESYNKMKGIRNKPDFIEVYQRVRDIIRGLELQKEKAILNKEKSL